MHLPKRFALTFFFLCVLGFVSAQDKTLELINIFDLEYVSDPQISPDGSQIVYVRNFKDIMTDHDFSNLWIIKFDGTSNRPLTTGNQRDFAPRWSPDGKQVLCGPQTQ